MDKGVTMTTKRNKGLKDAARVLLDADVTALVEHAMSDAVDETDDGTWVDEDRGACVGSAALTNAWTAALRSIAEGRA